MKLPFLTKPYKIYIGRKFKADAVFKCYLEKMPLVWDEINVKSNHFYLVYVVDPAKINVVTINYEEKAVLKVHELILPDGVRVKCPILLDNKQINTKLA